MAKNARHTSIPHRLRRLANRLFASRPPPASWSQLPDVALRAILSSVPLQQLIVDLPLVSSRWSANLSTVLAAKRHLVLCIGNMRKYFYGISIAAFRQSYESSKLNVLKLRSLDATKVSHLISLLPNITVLEVAICHVDDPAATLEQVAHLLQYWSSQLKTLKLRCQLTDLKSTFGRAKWAIQQMNSNGQLLAHFIDTSINPLPILEHLTLDLREAYVFNVFAPLHLHIVRQLKQFYIGLSNGKEYYDLLVRFGPTNEHQRLEWMNIFCLVNIDHRRAFLRFSLKDNPTEEQRGRLYETLVEMVRFESVLRQI